MSLDTGVAVSFRPIQPADRAALQRFHSRNSDRTTFASFTFNQRSARGQARSFTELDGMNRVALVALDPDQPSEIIAVVRFDRLEGTSSAEFAVIVGDAWQGHGLGTKLTQRLINIARVRGLTSLVAYVLPENARMVSLLHDLKVPETAHLDGYVEKFEIDIAAGSVDELPDNETESCRSNT